jgi:glycosyltransferase involved in cell wall biosynthesis
LLNDFSGSPLVLRQVLEAVPPHTDVHLYTATPSGKGFLSGIPGIRYHALPYRWHPGKMRTLLHFLWVQAVLFFRLCTRLQPGDLVYVNTLLPFGAALAAKCRRCRVVYHVHEVSIRPALLKRTLVAVAMSCAWKLVFVSEYVRKQFHFPPQRTTVIYNTLPDKFVKQALSLPPATGPFTVLMLCSPKRYKGIYPFVEVARRMPGIRFMLVLNADEQTTAAFRHETKPGSNCTVYPGQDNTIPFYEKAHLVVNFSLPDEWVETFGMTILEGMTCGRPAIVPPVGGVTEVVENGREGLYEDARRTDDLVTAIRSIAGDPDRYRRLAEAARTKATRFSHPAFRVQVGALIGGQSIPDRQDFHAMECATRQHMPI